MFGLHIWSTLAFGRLRVTKTIAWLLRCVVVRASFVDREYATEPTNLPQITARWRHTVVNHIVLFGPGWGIGVGRSFVTSPHHLYVYFSHSHPRTEPGAEWREWFASPMGAAFAQRADIPFLLSPGNAGPPWGECR